MSASVWVRVPPDQLGKVAQLVERLVEAQKVVGSVPTLPTTYSLLQARKRGQFHNCPRCIERCFFFKMSDGREKPSLDRN